MIGYQKVVSLQKNEKKGKLINNGRIIISEGGLITIMPYTQPVSLKDNKSSDAPLENHGIIDNKGTIDN